MRLRHPVKTCAQPLAVALACLLAFDPAPVMAQDAAPKKLNIVIVEGDGAINNIRQRTAREAIVQVEDENHRPVAGATVTFLLPHNGPGAALSDGSRSFTAVTDENGRAVLRGLRPNSSVGRFEIQVNASYQGATGTATITQANALPAAAAAAGGISGKLIAIIAIAGGAAAAGAAVALTRGNGTPAAPPPIVITPGAPTVGAPNR